MDVEYIKQCPSTIAQKRRHEETATHSILQGADMTAMHLYERHIKIDPLQWRRPINDAPLKAVHQNDSLQWRRTVTDVPKAKTKIRIATTKKMGETLLKYSEQMRNPSALRVLGGRV